MTAVDERPRALSTETDPARIAPNPDQPRKHFDQEALQELAESIKASGLLQPIVVRALPDEMRKQIVLDGSGDPDNVPDYLIVAGERRWRAALLAGETSVPVRVLEGMDDTEAYVMSVAENVARRDMTIIEEAGAYATLVGTGKSPEEVAALFGKTPSYVKWRLDLLTLRDDIASLVGAGHVKAAVAWYVAQLRPDHQQAVIARYVRGEFESEQEAIDYCQALKALEDQPVMFGEEEDRTPEEVEAQQAEREKAERQVDALLKLVQALEPFDDEPEVLAKRYEGQVGIALSKVETVASAVLKARTAMRKAKALVEAASAQPEAEATIEAPAPKPKRTRKPKADGKEPVVIVRDVTPVEDRPEVDA